VSEAETAINAADDHESGLAGILTERPGLAAVGQVHGGRLTTLAIATARDRSFGTRYCVDVGAAVFY
jgi:hypothetical protein